MLRPETLEDFKSALEVYRRKGETIESVTIGNVTGSFEGVPMVKLDLALVHAGAWSTWREFGYAKKAHPRGFGVIRRFSEAKQREV